MVQFVQRKADEQVVAQLQASGIEPLVARLLAGRGVTSSKQVAVDVGGLLRPQELKGAQEAGALLADAIKQGMRVSIVADYDCDGASACAVMVRGLELLGAKAGTVNYLVPDRQRDGYGLSPTIVDRVVETQRPDVIVTVDNGIASFDGVARAIALGLKVVVTDHHLPAVVDGKPAVPEATVIVNPSQPGCTFPSKALCGTGVAFYTLLMARSALRESGAFDVHSQPRLDVLLDLVALATVADVVPLDENNRRLVAQGLERIRSGRGNPGIRCLFAVAGRNYLRATSTDLGFTVGPRINSAGRLADMSVGIACLLANDQVSASELAAQLHKTNQERRLVEGEMAAEAEKMVQNMQANGSDPCLVVFDEANHEGVVGIVAGKLKERHHRPAFVFARSHTGDLKGSGRSIAGFHLRDALDLVAKRHPELILRFGGHAMAAGCTIRGDGVEQFRSAMVQVAQEWLSRDLLERKMLTDGPFGPASYTLDTVKAITGQVWGAGFEAPVFVDTVQVTEQKILQGKHLKLTLSVQGQRREGIWFGRDQPIEQTATLAYQVSVDEWQGRERIQAHIQGLVD